MFSLFSIDHNMQNDKPTNTLPVEVEEAKAPITERIISHSLTRIDDRRTTGDIQQQGSHPFTTPKPSSSKRSCLKKRPSDSSDDCCSLPSRLEDGVRFNTEQDCRWSNGSPNPPKPPMLPIQRHKSKWRVPVFSTTTHQMGVEVDILYLIPSYSIAILNYLQLHKFFPFSTTILIDMWFFAHVRLWLVVHQVAQWTCFIHLSFLLQRWTGLLPLSMCQIPSFKSS